MINLVRAEIFKLSRRPLVLVLLAVSLLLLVAQLAAGAIFAGPFGAMLSPAQRAEYARRALFPGIFGAVFGHINGLGGFFAVVLAAAAVGSEYSWGTLRSSLIRQPDRTRYLLAKCAAIVVLLALGICISLLVGALLAPLLGALVAAPVGAAAAGFGLLALPLALLRALVVLLPYALLTVAATVYTRSLLGGVALGVGYLLAEGGLGALTLFARLGGLWQTIYGLTIGQNINTLVLLNAADFGLETSAISPGFDAATLPTPLHAYAVVLGYSALALIGALVVFRRRDIGGAG